jgi:hypothetical protein
LEAFAIALPTCGFSKADKSPASSPKYTARITRRNTKTEHIFDKTQANEQFEYNNLPFSND